MHLIPRRILIVLEGRKNYHPRRCTQTMRNRKLNRPTPPRGSITTTYFQRALHGRRKKLISSNLLINLRPLKGRRRSAKIRLEARPEGGCSKVKTSRLSENGFGLWADPNNISPLLWKKEGLFPHRMMRPEYSSFSGIHSWWKTRAPWRLIPTTSMQVWRRLVFVL